MSTNFPVPSRRNRFFLKPSADQVNMNVIDGEGVVGLAGDGSGWFGGSPSTNHLCNQDGGRR